jgi:hypothetical protein
MKIVRRVSPPGESDPRPEIRRGTVGLTIPILAGA